MLGEPGRGDRRTSGSGPESTCATPPDGRAPTLVLHAGGTVYISIEHARYMAERMPNATLVELDSADHLIWFSDALDVMTDEMQDFLIGANTAPEVNRVLETVLVVELLDDARPLEAGVGCELIERFRGKAVPHGPARIVATFDGPGRAIRCGVAIIQDLRSRGLDCVEVCTAGNARSRTARLVASLSPSQSESARCLRRRASGVWSGSRCRLWQHDHVQRPRDDELEGLPPDWRVFTVTAV